MTTFGAHHHMFQCPSTEAIETYHSLKGVKWVAQHKFQCSGNLSPETYHQPKHVKFGELCFGAMCPCSMQNLSMPHPCPIHSTLHIFLFSHHHRVFFFKIQIYHYCFHHHSFVVDVNLGFWYQNKLMAVLENLYFFIPIILYVISFFFIFPFEIWHHYAWTILRTCSMSCFTCWSFLLFSSS